jgi:hypothetical protein
MTNNKEGKTPETELIVASLNTASDAQHRFVILVKHAGKLEQQRDELLAALKDILRIATAASIGITGNQPRLERARAAIASVEGK